MSNLDISGPLSLTPDEFQQIKTGLTITDLNTIACKCMNAAQFDEDGNEADSTEAKHAAALFDVAMDEFFTRACQMRLSKIRRERHPIGPDGQAILPGEPVRDEETADVN